MSDLYDVVTIVGNRPQFIKMAPVSAALKKRGLKEYVIHTGQHYDNSLSEVFFKELNIPMPDVMFSSPGKTHTEMTASMMFKIEKALYNIRTKSILLYGDTNSTLAAALVAIKLKIPFAHVEAGPRIYDIDTPEEINRIVADHGARILFAPNVTSVKNLAKENLADKTVLTGDVMYDAYLHYSRELRNSVTIFNKLGLIRNNFVLFTVHRPNNTDSPESIEKLLNLLSKIKEKVVFPIHPRTKAAFVKECKYDELLSLDNVDVIPPQSYLNVLSLVNNCSIVLTDSGGLQKEAYFASKPALILFYTTPWPEIEEIGWQKVVGCIEKLNVEDVVSQVSTYIPSTEQVRFFGDGNASLAIAKHVEKIL